MQKRKPRPLPIVWYVDDDQLPKDDTRDSTVSKIADALAAWEDDGTQSLNDLRKTINKILKIPDS